MIRPKQQKPSKAQEAKAYAIVDDRDDGVCQRCLKQCGPANRDHRKNRSVGGRTVASNLQILGGSGTTGCHGWKTSHPKAAIEEGWAVPGWADPLTYPARRWVMVRGAYHLGWVLYDDDGDWVEISETSAMRRMRRI